MVLSRYEMETAACDERRAESGPRKSTGKVQCLRVTPLCAVFQDCANPTEGKYIPPPYRARKALRLQSEKQESGLAWPRKGF